MPVDVLLGLQWGDEGKGKIVDVFTPQYDVVARFQGGPNAGHTIQFGDEKFVLHLIPSGIFHPETQCLIGGGVVIDPVTLRKEVEALQAKGIHVDRNLYIGNRATLILPTHKQLDAASESSMGEKKIGSTLRGIGPTYRDKIGREGLRIGDIDRTDFQDMYEAAKARHLVLLKAYGLEPELEAAEKEFFEAIEFLKGMQRVDSTHFLHEMLAMGRSVLAEGAQGTMLDIDFGSYPYVTSSNTITAGACTGLGIAPADIDRVFGIFKAYCTRVGSGPFPSELHGAEGEALRKAGHEFGATTGRPRRCGWLDLVALRYAIRINGVTDLIMTKADVLSTFEEIKVCVAYEIDGQEVTQLPYNLEQDIKPITASFPVWQQDITSIRHRDEIPAELNAYIEWLETSLDVPITILSVGPNREQTLSMEPEAVG